MSMSFAPSPTATVCSNGTPTSSAKRRSAVALPRGRRSRPRVVRQLLFNDSRRFAARCSTLQFGHQWRKDLHESARHDRGDIAQALQRAKQRSRTRRQTESRAHVVQDRRRQSRKSATPPSKCFGEVDLTRHRQLGDRRDLRRTPHSSASKSITSSCSNVESASITTRCLARRCRPARWTRQIRLPRREATSTSGTHESSVWSELRTTSS